LISTLTKQTRVSSTLNTAPLLNDKSLIPPPGIQDGLTIR
jgi:hypothetical protein